MNILIIISAFILGYYSRTYIDIGKKILKNAWKEYTKNDFKCYEYHRPNIPQHGCTTQCKQCKAIEGNE